MVSFEDFQKIELKVARIESAEPVPGADKLLKLTIDVGEKRTLVAGIAKNYSAQDLVGKQIIIVANLDPRAVRGILSQGMLLAADSPDGVTLLTVDKSVPPGTRVC
ncbi:methionine--tRNA ligase subunit beta [Candidatus Micrarchaeota archaeon]|nr:methionine--tRNA ligase subunit beta [Candidatus Micrarchaeota archaeon]